MTVSNLECTQNNKAHMSAMEVFEEHSNPLKASQYYK